MAVAFIACSVLGDRKGEPGSAIEQPVDVGPTVVGGIGGLITEACDTATQMVDVPVEYGNIGAVVAVVPRALNDPQRVQQLSGRKHGELQRLCRHHEQGTDKWWWAGHGRRAVRRLAVDLLAGPVM